MSALTYYFPDGLAANGRSYHANLHCYGAVCASNRWSLGTEVVLTAGNGRRVRLTVCDRMGQGARSVDLDTDPRTFRRLFGLLKVGRGSVRVRLVHSVPRVCSTERKRRHCLAKSFF